MLAAAHEMHQFDAVSVDERSRAPLCARQDFTVALEGDPVFFEAKAVYQFAHGGVPFSEVREVSTGAVEEDR